MEYYIFDLDGTLTDSSDGIINSIFYALDELKITKPEKEFAKSFIGPPLTKTFASLIPAEIKTEDAIKKYREYYATKGIYENKLYNGVVEMLEKLKKENKKIALGTAKPTYFAREILQHFNIYDAFDVVIGSHLSGGRTDKKDIIYEVKDQWGWQKSDLVTMVGDRDTDIIGGQHFDFHTIAVSYGYGSVEELTNCNPTHLVNSVDEITAMIK
jgi:phosphoglycolate phosphatase